jgi:polysaccharide deactylase WbmS-like protein
VNDVVATLDVDWAPDFAIDFTAELLAGEGVRSTWLVTHASPAIERLAARPDLFELGIHPNFAAGSSHGNTPQAVLDHCMDLLPGARTMRAHSLVTSSPLMNLVVAESPIVADLSIFLPHAPALAPVPYTFGGRTVYRIPFYWEDDYEYGLETPSWDLAEHLEEAPGLKIFNFHPIHVYLNSRDGRAYAELKAQAEPLTRLSEEATAASVNAGTGTRTLFSALVSHLAGGSRGVHVLDLVARLDSPGPA